VGHARVAELERIPVLLITNDEHTFHRARGIVPADARELRGTIVRG
jgi:hypothetical protein